MISDGLTISKVFPVRRALRSLEPGAHIRLFCFPFAGGGAAAFRRWPTAAAPWLDIWPMELPGRGARIAEKPLESMADLVTEAAARIQSNLDGPFALFGHSMGALLAFELVRRLRATGGPAPLHLFVSARRAPHLVDSRAPRSTLTDPELLDELTRLNGSRPRVLAEQELIDFFLPVIRRDLALCEAYRYRPEAPLSCPISAFGGDSDADISRDDLEQWRVHGARGFCCHVLPGDHFFIDPGYRTVLASIEASLDPQRNA